MIVEFHNFFFTPLWTDKPILKNINLGIEEGSITVILGDSRSGNQFLLQAMNRVVPEETGGEVKGEVIVDGLNVGETSIEELATHLVLLLSNPITQIVSFTVEGDVGFGPANLGLDTDDILKRVDFALEATRLKGFEKRNPNTLSGGEQQCCALAGLLSMRPKIVAMIDPVAMLDPMGKERIYSVTKSLNKEYGLTVIVSEAGMNIDSICEIADRMVVMDGGEIKLDGPPEEVVAHALTQRLGIPQVTELFLKLREKKPGIPLPVTLRDAVRYFRENHKERKVSSPKGVAAKLEKKEEPIIHVKNLYHTFPGYPPVHALRGISLDIYPGEFVGIIGQNGGGKTTLAYHLVGLLKPTNRDAEIIVDGLDPRKHSLIEMTKHINYAFQNPDNQFFCESVREELAYGLKNMGFSQEEIDHMSLESLKNFGVEEYLDWYIRHLPRDVKTYVAEATIAAMNPKVLIIDEPTGGLDTDGAMKMMESLVRLNNAGKTLIIITHDMRVIAQYARRVIAIKGGTILLDGPTREVFSKREILADVWLKPPQITQFGQELTDMGFPEDVISVDEMFEVCDQLL